ncbi:MAG: hypothetical protein AAFQ57_06735 [Cyanobacteria bacterium J06626_14]
MSRQIVTPCDVALAMATIPLVGGLLAIKAMSDILIQAGQASEEIFRGDRLPILHQPIHNAANYSIPDAEQ